LKQRARELNNGRAAMMGILGLMKHEVVLKGQGSPYIFDLGSVVASLSSAKP
jgi:hypothetical protein